MKKIYLIITIALLIGNPSIAKKKKPPIKGGTVVTNNSLIPHQVLITGPDDGGGAIIAKGWVLTAAHLNMGSTTNLYASVINRNNLNQGQQRQQIRFEKHPSYAGGNSPLNDIALLQLNQDFNLNANVGMIKLASPSNSSLWNTNQTVRVSGFGRTDTGSGLSDELRYVDVPVTSVDNTDKLIYAGATIMTVVREIVADLCLPIIH